MDCEFTVLLSIAIATVFLIAQTSGSTTLFDTMSRRCGGKIYLSSLPTGSLVLRLTGVERYQNLMDCRVIVQVEEHMKIALTFLHMDILSFDDCSGDYLMVLDSRPISEDTFLFHDNSMQRYCGRDIPEEVTSTSNNLTLRFVSDGLASGSGFSLLLTTFHKDECDDEEFKCDNNRCVNKELRCDDYNNCGDGSDSCGLPVYVIAAVAVVSILAVIAIIFLVIVLRYRCQQKHHQEEDEGFENDGYSPS